MTSKMSFDECQCANRRVSILSGTDDGSQSKNVCSHPSKYVTAEGRVCKKRKKIRQIMRMRWQRKDGRFVRSFVQFVCVCVSLLTVPGHAALICVSITASTMCSQVVPDIRSQYFCSFLTESLV